MVKNKLTMAERKVIEARNNTMQLKLEHVEEDNELRKLRLEVT